MNVLLLGVGDTAERSYLKTAYPENYVERSGRHQILTFGYNDGVDLRIGPDEDFAKVLQQLPRGWRPDLCLLWHVEWSILPRGIAQAPCPTVAFVGDWDYDIPLTRNIVKSVDLAVAISDGERDALRDLGASKAVSFYPQGVLPAYVSKKPKKLASRQYDLLYTSFIDDVNHPDRSEWILELAQLGKDLQIQIAPPCPDFEQYLALVDDSKLVFATQRYGAMANRVVEAMGRGAVVVDPGAFVADRFSPGVEYLAPKRHELAEQVTGWLRDPGKLQIVADRGWRNVCANYLAGTRFSDFLDFLQQQTRSGQACVAFRPPAPSHGETLYYESFRARVPAAARSLLEQSIVELARLDPSAEGLTNLAVAKASHAYVTQPGVQAPAALAEVHTLLERALAQDPSYAMALVHRAILLARSGDEAQIEPALQHALDALTQGRVNPWTLQPRDYDLFNESLRRPLNSTLRQLTAKSEVSVVPLFEAFLLQLGGALALKAGDPYQALELLQEAQARNPACGKAALETARLAALLGEIDQGLRCYDAALKAQPLNLDARLDLLLLLYDKGLQRRVIKELETLVQVTRRVAHLRHRAADVQQRIQSMVRFSDQPATFDPALDALHYQWAVSAERYLALAPDNLPLLLRTMEIWSELGRIDRVLALLHQAASAAKPKDRPGLRDVFGQVEALIKNSNCEQRERLQAAQELLLA